MKNNKGISVIALIITIIVLILIASITIYTGGNMIEQSRIRMANDRLSTVAAAIASHEEELGFAHIVVGTTSGDFRLLGVDDYEIMGLEDYKNDEQMPPIYVMKSAGDSSTNEKVYQLKTPKIVRINSNYEEEDYVYQTYTFYDGTNHQNIKVEFDTVKGVNRPLLTEDMMAVKMYYDDEGSIYSEPVKDIYDEDWYDYSNVSPNWANVKMNDNRYYVWIPRFAYKIQEFYAGTNYSHIPASAISIVFLKETTNYMANEEVLPAGYQVHPAFKYPDSNGNMIDVPGFWVSKYNVNDLVDVVYKKTGEGDLILGALEEVELTKLHGTSESVTTQLESHLLKNSEWAAIAYLSLATAGKTNDGTTLQNNPSAVMDLNVRQFVAGALKNEINQIPTTKGVNFDSYEIDTDTDKLLYETFEEKQLGDAITATSSGVSSYSAWFAGRSERISNTAPYILRGLDNSLFSYSASIRNPNTGAGCRNVLYVKTK